MTWADRFQARERIRGSLWLLPLVGGVLGAVLGTFVGTIDEHVSASFLHYSASTATTMLATIVGAMATVTGFVVTVTVLVVQMATGTFSARYMRLWYRDRMLKLTLALMVGTLTFSLALLRRIETDSVPDIGVTTAGFLVFMSLVAFVFFLDRYLHRLRPVAVATVVAAAGKRTFEKSLRAAAAEDAPDFVYEPARPAGEPTIVVRSHKAGSIQAINGEGLVRWAREHQCVLALPHVVGDFVPEGAVIFRAYGAAEDGAATEDQLRGMLALGEERTIEQDPAFAIRIMVDVAAKALSAAVNDPTTAIQVLDHLGDVLRLIGTTDLEAATKPTSELTPGRVIMRARRWEDFLALAVTEIREYGASTIQVNRRLRALLEELRDEVRPEHRAAVDDELARLDASVTRSFARSPDLDRAGTADGQGIGGPGESRMLTKDPAHDEVRS